MLGPNKSRLKGDFNHPFFFNFQSKSRQRLLWSNFWSDPFHSGHMGDSTIRDSLLVWSILMAAMYVKSSLFGDAKGNVKIFQTLSGWWYTYPSEKYESAGVTIPNMWKNKSHVPVTTKHSLVPWCGQTMEKNAHPQSPRDGRETHEDRNRRNATCRKGPERGWGRLENLGLEKFWFVVQ